MRKLYTLVFFVISASMSAQPILTNTANIPVLGTLVKTYTAPASIAPGPAGANMNWDYSTLTATESGTANYVDPGTTPYGTTFPDATYAIKLTPKIAGTTTYDYSMISDFKWEKIATGYHGTSTGSTYKSNPETILKMPLNFGKSFIDTFQKGSSAASTVTITYDGWGVLKTPQTTYYQAIRIRKDYSLADVEYDWYATNPLAIVMSYNLTDNSYTLYGLTNVNAIEDAKKQVRYNVYPNPSNGHFRVGEEGQKIKQIEVFDIVGNELKLMVNEGNVLDLSGYSNGMYILKVTGEEGKSVERVVVQ